MKTQELRIAREEFLTDMLTYYSGHPERVCMEDNTCKYYPSTDKLGISEGCAIGRKIDPELAKRLDKEFTNSAINAGVGNKSIFNLLPEELKVLGQHFLVGCQDGHDTVDWNNTESISAFTENMIKNYHLRKRTFKFKYVNKS